MPLPGGYLLTGGAEETEVIDDEGYLYLSTQGSMWSAWTQSMVSDGLLGAGAGVFDLASGNELWSRPDLGNPLAGFGWTPDGRQVRVMDEGTLTMLNGDNGETKWVRSISDWYSSELYTDNAMVVGLPADGAVEVIDRDSGSTAWRGDVATSSRAPQLNAALGDTTLVAGSDTTLKGWTGFAAGQSGGGEGDSPESGDPEYVTSCGSEPTFRPVESEAARGGLQVRFEVTAVCPDGQWLSADDVAVTLSSSGSAGLLAAGRFDFSDGPIWVPEGGVEMNLVFPARSIYGTATEVNDGIESDVIVVECVRKPGANLGEVPSSPEYGADPEQAVLAVDAELSEKKARESALAALKRIAAQDESSVEASMEGAWLPQLSSKLKGTTDDGITYNYTDILAEHLRLRLRYSDPGVRLVNSSDWGSFEAEGYWVTLVDSPTAGPGPALGFCRSSGFDRDHCYAKRLLRDGPVDGSTRLL